MQCYTKGSTGSLSTKRKQVGRNGQDFRPLIMTLVPLVPAEHEAVYQMVVRLPLTNTQIHSVLFGGDQLTVARTRGTQALRDTEETPVHRLEGIVPVVEDWHARVAPTEGIH